MEFKVIVFCLNQLSETSSVTWKQIYYDWLDMVRFLCPTSPLQIVLDAFGLSVKIIWPLFSEMNQEKKYLCSECPCVGVRPREPLMIFFSLCYFGLVI